jgi:hypothetical protein
LSSCHPSYRANEGTYFPEKPPTQIAVKLVQKAVGFRASHAEQARMPRRAELQVNQQHLAKRPLDNKQLFEIPRVFEESMRRNML